MAQDEACFGRISIPRRCWAPPKVRPLVARQVVREYVYVYSVVAPATGEMTSLLLPRANTAMMNLFLAHVAQEFPDYFIVMQMDRAGWHDTNDLVIPENIRLLLHHPKVLAVAVLFHAMVQFVPEQLPDLRGVPVFMGAGRTDSMIAPQQTERLAQLLQQAGADVEMHWQPGGHALNQAEVRAATEWFGAHARA